MLLSVNQAQTQPQSNQAQFNRLLRYYCYYLSLELLEHLEEATGMRAERAGAVQRYNESMAVWVSTEAAETRPATSRKEMRLQLGIGKVSLSALWGGSCSLISGRLLSIQHTQGSLHSWWQQRWQCKVRYRSSVQPCVLYCMGDTTLLQVQQIPLPSGSMQAHSPDSPCYTHHLFPSDTLYMQTRIPIVLHQPFKAFIFPILPQIWAFTSH